MKRRQSRKRKRPARPRQPALVVTVRESGEPVDIDAFCERYARLLIDEAQERAWLIQQVDPADR